MEDSEFRGSETRTDQADIPACSAVFIRQSDTTPGETIARLGVWQMSMLSGEIGGGMVDELQKLKNDATRLLIERLRANEPDWHEVAVEEVLTDFARNLCHVIAGIVANELPLSIKSRVMELSRKLPVG